MNYVTEQVENLIIGPAIAGGAFKPYIEQLIVDEIHKQSDDCQLTFVGFIIAIAVELMDNAASQLALQNAKKLAVTTYHEFLSDNMPELEVFGHPDYSWTKGAARQIAHDYQIDFWEVK